MPSLTSFLPRIAPTLRMETSTLYERQRSLVRAGMLPKPQGRGRGSGAEATPATVSVLLVSVLATDNWSETDLLVQALCHAAHFDLKKKKRLVCAVTDAETFGEALACTLADEKLDLLRPSVTVSRDTGGARIFWQYARRVEASHFGVPPEVMSEYIHREVTLPFRALSNIAKELRAFSEAQT